MFWEKFGYFLIGLNDFVFNNFLFFIVFSIFIVIGEVVGFVFGSVFCISFIDGVSVFVSSIFSFSFGVEKMIVSGDILCIFMGVFVFVVSIFL